VGLQELKATDDDFPIRAIQDAGYGAVWHGQRSWNGVAILARNAEPMLTRRNLPGDPSDVQARYIEAAVSGLLIGCLYLPNGNPQPGPKFDYKLAWFDRLIADAEQLIRSKLPVALIGDYNVVPRDEDIYPSKSWAKDALVQPQSRAAFWQLLGQGWTDAIRARHPEGPFYTFWDYKFGRWERDAGLRLDHILLSPDLAGKFEGAGVDRGVRGAEGASDHAPSWAMVRDVSCGILAGTDAAARPGSRPLVRRWWAGRAGRLPGRASQGCFCARCSPPGSLLTGEALLQRPDAEDRERLFRLRPAMSATALLPGSPASAHAGTTSSCWPLS